MRVQISVSKDDAWWEKLTKKQKQAYVAKHPNSKYAKKAAGKDKEANEDKGASSKTGKSLPKKQVQKLKVHWKKFSKDQKKMFKDGDHLPKSEERKGFKSFVKRKAKGVVKALKHEVHEWKAAGGGIRKLVNGKKPTKHEREAIKAVALHTAMVVGPMAITGGLSAGLGNVLTSMGVGLLEHTALIRGAQIAAFASESAKKDDRTPEDYLELLVNQMADVIGDADIDIEEWIEAALATSKKSKGEG